jgi:Bacterial membrane protein YfhO
MTVARSSAAREGRLTIWLLAAAAVLLGIMALPMFAGRVYVDNDLGEYHLPLRAFYSAQLRSGEAFDWLPSLFNGYYLTGEGQAGTYHPLHLLLYSFLPLGVAFDLEILLSYPLLLAGGYLLLRRWRLRRDAALLGACVFTFSGFNLLHFIHPNAVAVIAHWPWLLWAIDWALVPRRAAGSNTDDPLPCPAWPLAMISLIIGSEALIGYPQYVWIGLAVTVPYALWCAVRSPAPAIKRFIYFAVAVVAGVLLGGVQLLPTFDALAESTRQSANATFANSGSLHPLNMIQVVAPYLFKTRVVGQNTHELGFYFGAVPLLLALWLVLNRPLWGNYRTVIVGALCVAALEMVLAFGEHGLLGSFQYYMPLVGKFRFPCRSIVLVYAAVAVLAAIGWLRLTEIGNADRRTSKIFAITPAASVAAMLLGRCIWPDYVSSWSYMAIGPLWIAAAAIALAGAERGISSAMPLLVLLTMLDLGSYGLSYSVLPGTARLAEFARDQDMPPNPERPIVAQPLDPSRIDSSAGPYVGDRLLLAGFRRADGYAGLVPMRRLDFADPTALRIAGVGYRAIGDASGQPVTWEPVENPLRPVRLVTRSILDPGGPFPPEAAVPDAALVAEPLELPAGSPGEIADLVRRPGHVALSTRTETEQLVIVTESFHPGWQAKVDGQPAPVLRVNRDFLGVMVTPGEHQMTLDFHPFSLALGRALSTLGLGLMCAQWVVVTWFARRRTVGNHVPLRIAIMADSPSA